MTDRESSCLVHLVGSLELSSTEEVLRSVSTVLGRRAPRLPDGEVGSKRGWITTQWKAFERQHAFEKVEWSVRDWRMPDRQRFHFRLRDGAVAPTAEEFAPLGYSDWAHEAYRVFARLKGEGILAPTARLMIAIPSPYDILNFAVRAEDRPRIDFAYTEALLREVDRIAANLPHDQIALQWDIAHAFEYLATNDDKTFFPITRDQLVALLVQLGERVPSTVQLGYHCCYGNAFLKHFVEPTDTGEMVAVMNGVLAALERSVSFIHMPVPMDRADDAYFAPLKLLNAVPEMDIFLGLVHDRDGVEGAMKRARAARKAMPRFGIGTECGLQQRSQENAKELLQLQDRVAAAIEREPA